LLIITRLSCAVQVRDALVQREASLLPRLLAQALEPRSGNAKVNMPTRNKTNLPELTKMQYVEACVALLSHPLPSHVALPATAQNFMLQLFDRAATHPNATIVQQIHRLVYGACKPVLGVLSPGVLAHLEEYIFSILKSSSGVEDQSLGMYCLAIMRMILEKFQTELGRDDIWPTFDHSVNSTNSQWTPDAIKQFFHGNKTHKTMQLLVLRVIWACRPESADPTEQGLTSVTLVNQILVGVSQSAVLEWSLKNSAIVRKLQEKCLVPDMHPALRFQVLTFLSTLSEKVVLPSQATLFYEKALLDLNAKFLRREYLDLSLRLSLPRLTFHFKPDWWRDLLAKVMDLLTDSPLTTLFASAESYITFLEHIASMTETNEPCRRGILTALHSGQNLQKLEYFFADLETLPDIDAGHSASRFCVATYASLRNKLKSALCSLLLRAALAASQEDLFSIRRMLPAILKHHAVIESNKSACSICIQTRFRVPQQPIPFIEIEATPESQDASLHWKERLGAVMQTHAKYQETSLVASFINICHDLEARCESVEEPLRLERQKFADLETRSEALNKAYGDLEGQVMDRDLRINALEAETDRHDTDLAAASQESRELTRRIDKLTRELQEANHNARQDIERLRQENQGLEVQHATAIACKQEAFENVREQLHQARLDAENLRTELGNTEESRRHTHTEYEKLQAENERLEHQLLENQNRIVQIEEERTTLLEGHSMLEQDMRKLQQEIDERQKRCDSLALDIQTFKQQSEEETRNTTSRFEDVLTRAKSEWSSMKSHLEEQLEAVQEELAQAEDNFQQEHELNKQKNSDLCRRVERLTKDCTKKDAQVLEAQEMRNRLMNAMGLTGMIAPPPDAIARSSVLPMRSASTNSATPRTSLPSQVPFTPAPETQRLDGEAEDDQADDTFMSDASVDNGPTPKRARPRVSLMPANTQEKRTSVAPRSARTILRTRSAIKRQPLQDMPANRSPVQRAKSPSKVAFHNLQDQGFEVGTADRQDIEEWSFSADMMTGTPGTGRRDGGRDGLDESTADV
jgi:predicted  nucleic acid-binding Zn-ribbon protein